MTIDRTESVADALKKRVAQMAAYDISETEIAAATGLSIGRVSQLLATPELDSMKVAFAAEQFDKVQTLNDGWDTVEQLALRSTILAMNNNPDPDFALRVATVANRARRRGTFHNRPIDGGQNGIRTVVTLNRVTVDRLEQNFGAVKESNESGNGNGNGKGNGANGNGVNPKRTRNDTDYLPPQNVERLLQPNGVLLPLDKSARQSAREEASSALDSLFAQFAPAPAT